MSLEWARARLAQHCEALRKLCEAQAAARALQLAAERAERPPATVVILRKAAVQHPVLGAGESGTVLEFGQPGRSRRA
jgi:hypothetical protein